MESLLIDQEAFEKATMQFLKTPQGATVLKSFSLPSWLLLGVSVFQVVAGFLLLFTIRRTAEGFRQMGEGFSLKPLRDARKKELTLSTRLRPLICHGVYGNAQMGLGLVVGSFARDTDHTLLARLSRKLSHLYANGAMRAEDEPMLKVLRDDRYEPYRRRSLPEPYNAIPGAILFDVNIAFVDGVACPVGTVLHAFVAVDEPKGEITQIP